MMKKLTRLWFKFQLNKGLLIQVDNRHRGIGKSTMLVKTAVKFDIPILVGSQQHINNYKELDSRVKVIGFAENFTMQVLAGDFPNGVLVDESVSPKLISTLHDSKIVLRGGFINKENVVNN